MTREQMMQAAAIVLLVVVTIAPLVVWLLKREFGRVFDAIERIPSAEWFGEVRQALKKIGDHGDRLLSLEGRVSGLEARLSSGQRRFGAQEERLDEHHSRLLILEERDKLRQVGKV